MLVKLFPVIVLILVGGTLSAAGWRMLKRWDESDERRNETEQKRPNLAIWLLIVGLGMQVIWIFFYLEQAMCNPGQGLVGLLDGSAGEPCFPQ